MNRNKLTSSRTRQKSDNKLPLNRRNNAIDSFIYRHWGWSQRDTLSNLQRQSKRRKRSSQNTTATNRDINVLCERFRLSSGLQVDVRAVETEDSIITETNNNINDQIRTAQTNRLRMSTAYPFTKRLIKRHIKCNNLKTPGSVSSRRSEASKHRGGCHGLFLAV